jgi:hypothetical protein
MDGVVEASPEISAEEIETDASGFDEPRRSTSSRRKPAVADNFEPKELARAIQTVLKKDDKG